MTVKSLIGREEVTLLPDVLILDRCMLYRVGMTQRAPSEPRVHK